MGGTATLNEGDKRTMTKEELEKENAGLKETVTKMNNVITKTFSNLTKAKDIIKDLLTLHNDSFGQTKLSWRCNVIDKAEQFLKEVSE